jgi:hypothetical protein
MQRNVSRRRKLVKTAFAIGIPAELAAGAFFAIPIAPAGATTTDNLQSAIVPCDGSFHNYTTQRTTSGTSVSLDASGGLFDNNGRFMWSCGPGPTGMGYHANRCDSFTGQGQGELKLTDDVGATNGIPLAESGDMGLAETCWRYSIRMLYHTGSGNNDGGQFKIQESYK